MNILFNKKINPKLQINLNELSSTSDFSSNYNYNLNHQQNKHKFLKGGYCGCSDIFKAFKNENIELILYIIKHDDLCMSCQNDSGDTVLHLLIPYYNSYEEIKDYFDMILDDDCSDFINIQNNKGQTPILIAVINDNLKLAEKLENAGADPSIKDDQGNFVGINQDDTGNLTDNEDCEENIITIGSPIPPPNPTYNIYNLFIQKPNNDLSSLNINDTMQTFTPNKSDSLSQTSPLPTPTPTPTHNSTHLELNKIINIVSNTNLSKTSLSDSSDEEIIEIPDSSNNNNSSTTSLDTDQFITLLNPNNKPSFVKYSDIEDTDQFIHSLDNKYSSQSKSNRPIYSDTSDMNLSIGTYANRLMNETTSDDDISIISNKPNKPNKPNKIFTQIPNPQNPQNPHIYSDNKTSDMNISIGTEANRLLDETTSDDFIESKSKTIPMNIPLSSNPYINIVSDNSDTFDMITSEDLVSQTQTIKPNSNIFYKTNSNHKNNIRQVSSDIDTSTLYKAIHKIIENYPNDKLNIMEGGARKTKQQIMGYRKFNQDSELEFVNNHLSIDYNKIYNSESEIGSKSKNMSNQNLDPSIVELSRMMSRQKENIHREVLEMIMDMLNRGVLLQSNKPIEASEKNAKLVKAYLYRQVCEQNPDLGGMDKILSIKSMNENDIINVVKKMPSLDELEESIRKHLEEKNKNKLEKSNESIENTSDTSESSESAKPKNKKK